MLRYSPDKIKELMASLGLNQSELARKAEPSVPSIWALVRGETKMPKADTLLKVAAALGVPLQAILKAEQPADLEAELHATVKALKPENQAAVLAAAKSLLQSQKKR